MLPTGPRVCSAHSLAISRTFIHPSSPRPLVYGRSRTEGRNQSNASTDGNSRNTDALTAEHAFVSSHEAGRPLEASQATAAGRRQTGRPLSAGAAGRSSRLSHFLPLLRAEVKRDGKSTNPATPGNYDVKGSKETAERNASGGSATRQPPSPPTAPRSSHSERLGRGCTVRTRDVPEILRREGGR